MASTQSHSPSSADSSNHEADATPTGNAVAPSSPPPPRPSLIKRVVGKLGIDAITVILAIKGSLPPVIAIALYQAHSYEDTFTTLGYLTAIVSVLGLPILPRARFLQNLILTVFSTCFFAAVNLLALYCVTKARAHTTTPGERPGQYNSSASAVCAIWLIFDVYCISVVRALRPQLVSPTIIGAIFCLVSLSYGVALPDMTAAIMFVERLLKAFLSGLGIATGVNLFIFPITSRKAVIGQMTGYVKLLGVAVKHECAYMASLENLDAEAIAIGQRDPPQGKIDGQKRTTLTMTAASVQMKGTMSQLFQLMNKIGPEVTAAKREIAYGKLEAHDFAQLWKLLRRTVVPIMGLSTLTNMLQSRAESGGWDQGEERLTDEQRQQRHAALAQLGTIMKLLHEPFAAMSDALASALQHVLITLEFVKAPGKANDVENPHDDSAPGNSGFALAFKRKIDDFHASKENTIREWFHQRGIELPPDMFSPDYVRNGPSQRPTGVELETRQQTLFFVLYLEHMMWQTGLSLLELVTYVDKRKAEGAFRRSRLIFPALEIVRKWFRSACAHEDVTQGPSFIGDLDAAGVDSVYLGREFLEKRDPEHFPPQNVGEHIGEAIRAIPRFFRSNASSFGLRVVLATMSIAIVNFLSSTQMFFIRQRLIWAEIMVTISMTRTAGQSIFTFLLRVIGTAISAVITYVIWYIVDGKTAGVIVFLWVWIASAMIVIVKKPQLAIAGIISVVTSVLIIGYELQVRKLGKKAAEANGQPAYPIYTLAPYRLATVLGGLLVAFIWTIFPYPVSESSEVRKDLAATLYLLSNFYSIAHESVLARVKGNAGSETQKGTHLYNLERARVKVFTKLLALISVLRTNSKLRRFQLTVGGKFPAPEYDELIDACHRLVQWISLIGFTAKSYDSFNDVASSAWQRDFRNLLASTQLTSHEVTSLLTLLSSSLSHGQALPPYVQLPSAFQLTRDMNSLDTEILSLRHLLEPEFSAFAVFQALTHHISVDVAKIKRIVTILVGEVDFSFHPISTTSLDSGMATDSELEKDKSI